MLPIALAYATCLQAQEFDARNLAPRFEPDIAQRYALDHLQLYPITARALFLSAHSGIGATVPLNAALQDGRLRIEEHADGAQVNTLQAVNTSTDTIYLMQGEVVVGGQQDRVLAQDVLVPPGARMDIAAFCVEHGRWSENGSGQAFTATIGLAAQDVRKAAAVDKEQGRVWERVADNVAASGASAPSGSYAALLNDAGFQAARERYRERLRDLPEQLPGVVGVVAVSGDRVIGCDVFATEALLRQAYPQLIDAYIAQALGHGGPVRMAPEQVQAWFADHFASQEGLEKKAHDNGSLFKAKNRTYRVSMF